MFTQHQVDTLLERLDTAAHRDELWIRGHLKPPRVDVFSAMEPDAQRLLEEGHGPGGDPVWLCALLDQGWPEWLIMLMLSLAYTDIDADENGLQRLPAALSNVSGGPEDAEAFLFTRACVSALATQTPPNTLRARYVLERLGSDHFGVLGCLEAAQRTHLELEPLITWCKDLTAQLTRGPLSREARFASRAQLRALRSSQIYAEVPCRDSLNLLLDFAGSALQIDDYTPLDSLRWPVQSPQSPWAPTTPELFRACRAALLIALTTH